MRKFNEVAAKIILLAGNPLPPTDVSFDFPGNGSNVNQNNSNTTHPRITGRIELKSTTTMDAVTNKDANNMQAIQPKLEGPLLSVPKQQQRTQQLSKCPSAIYWSRFLECPSYDHQGGKHMGQSSIIRATKV